ncbi:hypothetical protein ACE1TF_05365 [Geomicrobium sp. JSM 1781026]|uniref:hypothetical protein n=1 Tax=Geomicrobium sp. JSM 1781026 TaxID=3344580 RepID=UPI0035C152C6
MFKRERRIFGSKRIARIVFFSALGVALFVYVPFLIGGEVFDYDTEWLTNFMDTIAFWN